MKKTFTETWYTEMRGGMIFICHALAFHNGRAYVSWTEIPFGEYSALAPHQRAAMLAWHVGALMADQHQHFTPQPQAVPCHPRFARAPA